MLFYRSWRDVQEMTGETYVKRILFILSSLDAGGAETFLMKAYRALPPDEYQFDFIVSADKGCYAQEVLDRGGRIYVIPERRTDLLGAMAGIRRIVRERGYDAVLKLADHSLAALDLVAAKRGGARCLALRSCNAPTGLSLRARTIHRLLRPVANRVATVKLAPSRLAGEFMFGKAKDVQILHNGVDLSYFRYLPEGRVSVREEFDFGDRLVVGHIGRFHPQKNHGYLLEVFAELRRSRQDAALLLVGTGALEGEIRERIRRLGLEDHVILAGQRFDIPEVLSAMDVFLFPSLHEGMPNTVIEAQATGLPCVIADTITREADLTGLVRYISLDESPAFWTEQVLSVLSKERVDTAPLLTERGYDIHNVAWELVALLTATE